MYTFTHLTLEQNGRQFDRQRFVFKYIFLTENDRIRIQISLKFVPRSPIDNKPLLMSEFIDACMLH